MFTHPTISLTTDFGLADPFVGVMHGVIAGICPIAHVIDVTHAVAAFDLLDGALAIWQSWGYFPAETVHVVVVDPGVGSERQPVLSRMGNYWFIAPDNGVLTLVERDVRRMQGSIEHRSIQNPLFMLPGKSHTFHGRDIFAPTAAHLAAQLECGQAMPETFGPIVESLVQLYVPEPTPKADGSIEGIILKVDRFGNLLTNLAADIAPANLQGCWMEIGSLRIGRFCNYFAEGKPEEVFGIIGSSGLLELAVNRGSAQKETGIIPGTTFRLIPTNCLSS